jgi:branched-chain amino acid transport system ATP-binding protein
LAVRRDHPAKVPSGPQRRLLEISWALAMNPDVLVVDEPSIDLESRFTHRVFEILHDLEYKVG